MKFVIFAIATLVFVASEVQGQCSFACTSQASFNAIFDGSSGSATCSNGRDLSGRCSGCCEAWAMSRGQSKDSMTGFVSSDGSRCTCCGNLCGGSNPQFSGRK